MADIEIRAEGRCGRITLNRPQALNALNASMMAALDAALRQWAGDQAIDLVVIDAAGSRAFCAGGDLAELYAKGVAGQYGFGRDFWRDEYRMNARIAAFAKPVVTLMQGFTMGGGVGVGCHASHRIVGETSLIAMPECGIGLVPDVGGSYLLSQGPGRLGAYLGTTGSHMGPADAIYAGFADHFVPGETWPAVVAALVDDGIATLPAFLRTAPEGRLPALQADIDRHFAGDTPGDILRSLMADDAAFAQGALMALGRVSPLAASAAIEMQHRLGSDSTLLQALALEYRFTYRAQDQSDFLEGIRAAIIDKDRKPRWRHGSADAVPAAAVAELLAPLGAAEWTLEAQT